MRSSHLLEMSKVRPQRAAELCHTPRDAASVLVLMCALGHTYYGTADMKCKGFKGIVKGLGGQRTLGKTL